MNINCHSSLSLSPLPNALHKLCNGQPFDSATYTFEDECQSQKKEAKHSGLRSRKYFHGLFLALHSSKTIKRQRKFAGFATATKV